MNEWSEETVYLITNVTSILFCVVFGILLLDMRDYCRFIRRAPVFPGRYIMARKTLGIAYLVINLPGQLFDWFRAGLSLVFSFASISLNPAWARLYITGCKRVQLTDNRSSHV